MFKSVSIVARNEWHKQDHFNTCQAGNFLGTQVKVGNGHEGKASFGRLRNRRDGGSKTLELPKNTLGVCLGKLGCLSGDTFEGGFKSPLLRDFEQVKGGQAESNGGEEQTKEHSLR